MRLERNTYLIGAAIFLLAMVVICFSEDPVKETMTAPKAMKLGMEAYNQGDYIAAIPYFNIVLNDDPLNEDALFYRGDSYFRLENYDMALQDMYTLIDMGDSKYMESADETIREIESRTENLE